MNPQSKTHETNPALLDRRIGLGLRELDRLDTPPDVAEAVRERLAGGVPPRQRASNVPVLLVAMLAIAATAAVFVFREEGRSASDATYGTPQDAIVETVRSEEQVAQLPAMTKHVRGTGLSSAAIVALRKLRKLERLELNGCPTIDADYVTALGGLNGLVALQVEGTFAAPASAMKPLGVLPRLTDLALIDVDHGIDKHESDPPTTEHGLQDEHVIAIRLTTVQRLRISSNRVRGAFLPTLVKSRLRELSLMGCRELDAAHLAGLPKLRALDLTDTGVRDATTRLRPLKGCVVACSNGLRLRMPTDPKQEPERLSWTVELSMRTGGAYENSALSFCQRTTDPALHANYVDLVWSACKNVHIQNYGRQNNRIRDLGKMPLAQVRAAPDAWDDLTSSFAPTPGHTYAFEVRDETNFDPFIVVFQVVSVTDTTLTLAWHHLDETQDPGRLPRRGAAGASGACGGPHEPR